MDKAFVESIDSYDEFLGRGMFDSWNKNKLYYFPSDGSIQNRICLGGNLKKALMTNEASLI